MAVFITVDVYDFSATGNSFVKKQQVGLPTAGAMVFPVKGAGGLLASPAGPDGRTYIYSRISYPGLGLADPNYLTAETVAQILTKMNA